MFRTFVIAASILLAVVLATPYYPAGWVDLYKPPYQNMPTIIMSLACIRSDYCLVPGMTNGAGVGVYTMNGEYNAALNEMNMIGEMPIAIMGLAAGGTPENPHGVAGGPDIMGGLKYLENRTTWNAPLALPFAALIGITADAKTGLNVAFPDLLVEGLWISNDGGFEYSMKNTSLVELPTDNCTYARFIAYPTTDVIYMTYGNFPNSSKNSDFGSRLLDFVSKKSATSTFTYEYAQGRSLEFRGDGKEFKHHRKSRLGRDQAATLNDGFSSSSSSSSSDNPDNHCPYSAAVVKSNDGGNTWSTILSELGTYYPNEIACASTTHCAMVIESADGAGVMRTTDGVHFEKVFWQANTDSAMYALQTIAVSPANSSLWFAAGGMETQQGDKGFVARSEDGGATWVAETPLNFLAEIMKLTISTDGVVFAAAETLFQAGTILRYPPNGPLPTPAPAYNGDITQKVWATGDCTGAVNSSSFAQGQCLQMNGGGSLTMSCDMTDGVITQQIFILSDSCQGPYEQGVATYDTCLQANGGGTVEFFCSAQSEAVKGTVGVSIKK